MAAKLGATPRHGKTVASWFVLRTGLRWHKTAARQRVFNPGCFLSLEKRAHGPPGSKRMKARSQWQGMMTIARFNWPLYVAAAIVCAASVGGLVLCSVFAVKFVCGVVLAGAAYFILGSLGVSHLVYDRSDLYRWGWLERALHGLNMQQAIFCHSGFDETSAELRGRLGHVRWQILDHFNEKQMTEASIRRARAWFPPAPETLPARYDAWPMAAE